MSLYALCVRLSKEFSYTRGVKLTFAVIGFQGAPQNHSSMGGGYTAGSDRPTRRLARRA